jgi:hypothetical protein
MSMQDITYIMVGAFTVAVIFLVVNTIMYSLADSDTVIGDSADFDEIVAGTVGIMDYLIVFAFFGAFTAAIILAAMTRSTPVMFGVGIVFLIIAVFISPLIANVYSDIVGNPGIEASGHTGLDAFFQNLPTIILIVGSAILLALRMGGGSE